MRRFFKEDHMIDKWASSDKSVKAGVAERMIRTIKSRLYRYCSEHNTENWVDAIGDIFSAINNSPCRVTRMRPIDVNQENAEELWKRLYGSHVVEKKKNAGKYKREDAVRLALDKPVFRKGTLPTFTDEIFRINDVVQPPSIGMEEEPTHYYLRDHKGEILKGRVYGPEMAKTREEKETVYRIEQIIRSKKDKSGKKLFLVKFYGYPSEYWIKAGQFVTK